MSEPIKILPDEDQVKEEKIVSLDLPEVKTDVNEETEDFIDISKKFAEKTQEINLDEEEPDEDPETQAEFVDAEEVTEEYLEEEEEDPDDYENDFFNTNTIASLIAGAHNIFLPPMLISGYKRIFFKPGEWEQIQSILVKQEKALDQEKNYNATKSELKLLKTYRKFCNFRDNKAPLTEEQTERLQKAWEYQLRKWGIDNKTINMHPLLEAYGSIVLEKGGSMAMDKVM